MTKKDFDWAVETAYAKKKIDCSRAEIYMSDARKAVPEKWKTVIRHPICKKG